MRGKKLLQADSLEFLYEERVGSAILPTTEGQPTNSCMTSYDHWANRKARRHGLSSLSSADLSWNGWQLGAVRVECRRLPRSGSRSRFTTNGLHQQPTAFRLLRNVSTTPDTQRGSPALRPRLLFQRLMDTSASEIAARTKCATNLLLYHAE